MFEGLSGKSAPVTGAEVSSYMTGSVLVAHGGHLVGSL
jgi:hypothetical protein